MASFMAVGRENASQEEMASFSSLLRTFLPEHSDLPMMDSTDQLLQQVKSSLPDHSCADIRGLSERTKPADQITAISHMEKGTKPETTFPKQYDMSLQCSSKEAIRNLYEKGDGAVNTPKTQFDTPTTSEKAISNRMFLDRPLKKEDPKRMKHFACFLCDAVFKDLAEYSAHMTAHCNDNAFIHCKDCKETFNSVLVYNNHRRLSTYEIWVDRAFAEKALTSSVSSTKDEGTGRKKKRKKGIREEKYVCRACGKLIYKYSSFLRHVRTHEGISAFCCAVCQETFDAPCMLRTHIDLEHSHVLPFQCRRCLKRFKLKCSLSTHLNHCQMDHSTLPFAEEIQYIDQLSEQRKFQGIGNDDGLSQYSCPICTKMYDSPEELKQHLKHHDETKPYKCKECGRGFTTSRMRDKHEVLHQTRHDCRCEICGVQLLTMSGYNAHLRGHRNQELIQAQFFADSSTDASGENSTAEPALEILQRLKSQKGDVTTQKGNTEKIAEALQNATKRKKKYPCPMCGLLFYSGGAKFQIHARKEHKNAEFEKCVICNKSFFGHDNLEHHLKLHKMFTETFTCEECGKTFRRKYALLNHKKMHTFKKFVKCDICGQEFRFITEVDKHKNKKHRYDRMLNIYKCNVCGQRFPMLSHLSVHCYCHNLPDSKPFECDLCKISFKTSIELKQHIYQKHDKLMKRLGESAYMPDTGSFLSFADPVIPVIKQEPLDDEDGQSATNDSCKAGESQEKHNSNHSDLINESATSDMEKSGTATAATGLEGSSENCSNVNEYNFISRHFSHNSKILKRYSCEVCQKAFASNSDLKTHRRTHSGETPFKCDYCDRSFKQRGHRKLHIQVVHTKVMPYKCEQCDAAFPTRSRYQIHLKRHLGLREYKCQYCDKEFYTLGKLNEHKKRRHTVEMRQEQPPAP